MFFSVNRPGGLFMVGIVKSDGGLSAFSRHLLRFYFPSVHKIRHFLGNRQISVCGSLVINVSALCLPGNLISLLAKSLIALYIFNVLQIRSVFYGIQSFLIFQPFADNHIFDTAVGVSHHIHCLFLAGIFIFRACSQGFFQCLFGLFPLGILLFPVLLYHRILFRPYGICADPGTGAQHCNGNNSCGYTDEIFIFEHFFQFQIFHFKFPPVISKRFLRLLQILFS